MLSKLFTLLCAIQLTSAYSITRRDESASGLGSTVDGQSCGSSDSMEHYSGDCDAFVLGRSDVSGFEFVTDIIVAGKTRPKVTECWLFTECDKPVANPKRSYRIVRKGTLPSCNQINNKLTQDPDGKTKPFVADISKDDQSYTLIMPAQHSITLHFQGNFNQTGGAKSVVVDSHNDNCISFENEKIFKFTLPDIENLVGGIWVSGTYTQCK